MDKYTATELAFKHGYEKGYEAGKRDANRKITRADSIRAMTDEDLACHLSVVGWDCHNCSEHDRLDNEPLLRMEKCDEDCVVHCLEWLQQPAREE